MRRPQRNCFPKNRYSFPKVRSLNRYVDPLTKEILVEVGDILSPEVVETLGQVGAVRVKPDVGIDRAQALTILRLQAKVLGIEKGTMLDLHGVRYLVLDVEREQGKGGEVVYLTLRRRAGKVLYETASYWGGEFGKPWRKTPRVGWHMEMFAFSMKELAERNKGGTT